MISPQVIEQRKRSIERRMRRDRFINGFEQPVLSATNIQYELAERNKAINYGGIGLIHMLASQSGLIDASPRRLHLLKVLVPDRDSDHGRNIAYHVAERVLIGGVTARAHDGCLILPDERQALTGLLGDFLRRSASSFNLDALHDELEHPARA